MGHLPEETIETLLRGADAVWPGGYSAVLYGSLARGDFHPGHSDLNLLIVAPDLGAERLRALGPALAAFQRSGLTPPLLLTAAEWIRAADVFPVEITDMRLAYRVLRGADPLPGLQVRPADLRRALEFEWRGKMLRLRQELAAHLDQPDQLGLAAGGSAPSVRVLLRATLVMAGRIPPAGDEELAREAGRLTGAAAEPLAAALAHRRDPSWRCDAATFERYLGAVEQVTRHVDHFPSGDS
jgi:hypothetical protein